MRGGVSNLTMFARALGALIAVMLGLAAGVANADRRLDPGGDWQLTEFTTREGLPQNWVTSMAQTPEGFLWIGTHGGLARFDGVHFKVFDIGTTPALGSNRIEQLFTASNGDLWITTSESTPVRLRNGVFTSFAETPRVPHRSTRDIAEDGDGNLWFAGRRLVRWDGESFETVDVGGLAGPEVRPTSLLRDRAGVLWLASAAGVAWLDGGRWQLCTQPDDFPRTHTLGESARGIWAADDDRLAYVEEGHLTPVELSGLPLGRIQSTLFDSCGLTWIGTDDRLMQLVESEAPDGSLRTTLVEVPPGGLTAMSGIDALLEDHEGNIWVSRDGLLRIRQQQVVSVPLPRPGREYPVVLLTDSTGESSWVTGFGDEPNSSIVRWRDGAWETLFSWEGRKRIRRLEPSHDGGLWIVTRTGELAKLRKGQLESFDHGLEHLFGMSEAPDGTLWLLTETGFTTLRDGEFQTLEPRTLAATHHEQAVSVSWSPRGDLLVAWPNIAMRRSPDGTTTYLTAEDGLPAARLRSIHQSKDGAVWLATYGGGLVRWLDGELTMIRKRDGLPDNSLGKIAADDRGYLWINSNLGLFRVLLEDLTAFAEHRTERVPVRLLSDAEGDGPEGGAIPDGRLWVRTTDSICFVDPASILGQLPPPRIAIEQVEANDQLIDHRKRIVVPPGDGVLRIKYSVIAMTALERVHVRTMLVGRDAGWVDSENTRIAHYANVSPGKYSFLISACNEDGSWEDSTASLDVEFVPLFWQTRWFTALVVLGLVGLVVLGHLLRTRGIRLHNARLHSEIGRRRRAEDAHRLQADRLQMALSSADMGTWHWDPERQVSMLDPSLSRMFGFPDRATTMPTEEFTAHFHPEDREAAFAAFDRAVAEHVDLLREYRIVRADGKVRWLRERGRPHYDSAGELAYVTGACLEITDRKRAEAEREGLENSLRQAQKMEAVGQLAAGVAHEFNNLLVGILCNAELVIESKQPRVDEETLRRVRDISRCSERAAALTHKLLSFAKRDTMTRTTFSLNEVVSEAETMLRGVLGTRVELELELEADLPRVRADRSHVEQGLINLLLNARDAIDGPGKVTIATSSLTVDGENRAREAALEPGDYVTLTVTDTGCGMDPRTLERIFEPFFTTKPTGEGTGLGLSTLFADMSNNGGHVSVESREGVGSTFRVHLPLAGRAEPTTDQSAELGRPPTGTILVCDDERAVLVTLAAVLASGGYGVLEACGPEEARTLSAEYDGPIDLLLVDVMMPGSTGPQLAEELVAQRPNLSVLYMSGYPAEVLRVEGQEFEFIKKPPTRATLLRRVGEVLARVVER